MVYSRAVLTKWEIIEDIYRSIAKMEAINQKLTRILSTEPIEGEGIWKRSIEKDDSSHADTLFSFELELRYLRLVDRILENVVRWTP